MDACHGFLTFPCPGFCTRCCRLDPLVLVPISQPIDYHRVRPKDRSWHTWRCGAGLLASLILRLRTLGGVQMWLLLGFQNAWLLWLPWARVSGSVYQLALWLFLLRLQVW